MALTGTCTSPGVWTGKFLGREPDLVFREIVSRLLNFQVGVMDGEVGQHTQSFRRKTRPSAGPKYGARGGDCLVTLCRGADAGPAGPGCRLLTSPGNL